MMAALLAVSPVAAQTEVAPDNWVTPGTAEGNPIFRARGTTPRSPRSSAVRVAARGWKDPRVDGRLSVAPPPR